MSTLKVDGIRSNSASSDAITLASDGTCTANITNNLSNRNLIINGAMQVAQRATSATAEGYATVDRFSLHHGGEDQDCTQSQHALTSSDTGPWEEGFRHSYHIQNGNQTSGGDSGDFCYIRQKIEGQNITSSGWNYLSASSYITVSFWIKSSVAFNSLCYAQTYSGTDYSYPFETGNLSANTWTKITKTIPGNSNLVFDADNNQGMQITWGMYWGSDFTDNSTSLNTWAAYNSSQRLPDMASTWWTTNDATFEVTGVQLEVSDHATDFEHRSYAQELQLCLRYYEQFIPQLYVLARYDHSSGSANNWYFFEVEKRAAPTGSYSGTFTSNSGYAGNPQFSQAKTRGIVIKGSNDASASGIKYLDNSGDATCKFDAEL